MTRRDSCAFWILSFSVHCIYIPKVMTQVAVCFNTARKNYYTRLLRVRFPTFLHNNSRMFELSLESRQSWRWLEEKKNLLRRRRKLGLLLFSFAALYSRWSNIGPSTEYWLWITSRYSSCVKYSLLRYRYQLSSETDHATGWGSFYHSANVARERISSSWWASFPVPDL